MRETIHFVTMLPAALLQRPALDRKIARREHSRERLWKGLRSETLGCSPLEVDWLAQRDFLTPSHGCRGYASQRRGVEIWLRRALLVSKSRIMHL